MRTIFSIAVFLSLSIFAAAQEQDRNKYGFIRLVNAVAPGEGPVELLLNGNNLYPDGYQLGAATGGMGVELGRCKVVVQREGLEPGETKVEIEAGETTTVIPFAERVPATDDKPAHWQIRILRLKQKAQSKEREATFISVSRQPEIQVEMRDPEGNWSKHIVKRFMTTSAPMKYPEGYVPLRLESGDLPSIPVLDIGNYVVVLYDDPEGNVKALNFRDFHHLTAE
ncbi:hypothetical protein [Haloferula sp.]|uniref:hypothetical protein n=1 Tax=Haloferula sp. TaxID=2497595 RepID=UPI003C744228